MKKRKRRPSQSSSWCRWGKNSNRGLLTWQFWYFLTKNDKFVWRRKMLLRMRNNCNSKLRSVNWEHCWTRFQKTTLIKFKTKSLIASTSILPSSKSWWKSSSWRLPQKPLISTYTSTSVWVSSRSSMILRMKKWTSRDYSWANARTNSTKWCSRNKQTGVHEELQWIKLKSNRRRLTNWRKTLTSQWYSPLESLSSCNVKEIKCTVTCTSWWSYSSLNLWRLQWSKHV